MATIIEDWELKISRLDLLIEILILCSGLGRQLFITPLYISWLFEKYILIIVREKRLVIISENFVPTFDDIMRPSPDNATCQNYL